jgi:predicted NAD/FAD-binding protein
VRKASKNIAVVGAGVSGLVAAHLLAREHRVTVFEAGDHAGGHTNTVEVDDPRGPLAVDTGFIVLNDRNYPRFESLLSELGVATQPSDMSFSVSDGRGRFEYSGSGPNGLFARRAHLADPRFLHMVAEYRRFNADARALLDSDEDPSLREWLGRLGYGDYFVERLIVPQAAAVWSADPAQMASFPARFLVQFFFNHGMLGFRDRPRWRTVSGGAWSYVRAIVAGLGAERVRLRTPVTAVRRCGDHVLVTPRGGAPERFDEVVLALHADDALAILADPSPRERELLGAFAYQANEAVLHTDEKLLPRRRRARASWNYHLLEEPLPVSTVTYDMNRLQRLETDQQYCVTLNLSERIDPQRVIAAFSYRHPVFTHAGMAAQERYAEIGGVDLTHYCGAYWRWGFHEDGVVSAHRVADAIAARAQEALAA